MMHLNMRAFQKRVLKWRIRDNRGSPSFGSGWRFVSVWPQGPPKADSQRMHKERKAWESFQLKRCRLTLAREKRTRNCLRQLWKLFRVDPTSPPQRIVIPSPLSEFTKVLREIQWARDPRHWWCNCIWKLFKKWFLNDAFVIIAAVLNSAREDDSLSLGHKVRLRRTHKEFTKRTKKEKHWRAFN